MALWRKHAAVVSCGRAAGAWSLFCSHVVCNGQHGLHNRISVCADQRTRVAGGQKLPLHSFESYPHLVTFQNP